MNKVNYLVETVAMFISFAFVSATSLTVKDIYVPISKSTRAAECNIVQYSFKHIYQAGGCSYHSIRSTSNRAHPAGVGCDDRSPTAKV